MVVAIFNSSAKTRIHISAAGDVTIEAEAGREIFARTKGGVAAPLAFKSELDEMRSKFLVHIHPLSMGTSSATTTTVDAPVGTTVLKGE